MATSIITTIIFALFFLFCGIYSLIKKKLPVIGFEDWFTGMKGKVISIVLIIIGLVFLYGAVVMPDQAMRVIDYVFSGCSRKD